MLIWVDTVLIHRESVNITTSYTKLNTTRRVVSGMKVADVQPLHNAFILYTSRTKTEWCMNIYVN
jgi:hypothetical protein